VCPIRRERRVEKPSARIERVQEFPAIDLYIYIKRLSSVQQEVFTHRHDQHQTSVSKAVARVVEVSTYL
jgi:hypothetical protein